MTLKKKSEKIMVITSGLNINSPFLFNYITIISNLSKTILLLMSRTQKKNSPFGKEILVKNIMTKNFENKSVFQRIFIQIINEILISLNIIFYKKYDSCVFFLSQSLLLPIITSKIFKKKVILHLGASISDYHKFSNDKLAFFYEIQERLSFIFADKLVVYSPILINSWNLNKYKNKIIIAYEHIIDTKIFHIKKKYDQRDDTIGYVGRLNNEKGIINFIKAIKIISKKNKNLNFSITGNGPLKKEVNHYIIENDLSSIIKLNNAIPHQNMAFHLNELKLLVIPSYTEGLPNIMLESMACGTPVLVNNVGSVPDFIIDEYNGYVLKNNSPENIANSILKIMKDPPNESIINNALSIIEENFVFQKTFQKWIGVI